MREINILAHALAGEFGSAQRVADEARIVIRRERLGRGVRGLYLPTRGRRLRAILLLSRDLDALQRDELLRLALGHHFLRHRALPWYQYLDGGRCTADERAGREAALFAAAFLEACQPLVHRGRAITAPLGR